MLDTNKLLPPVWSCFSPLHFTNFTERDVKLLSAFRLCILSIILDELPARPQPSSHFFLSLEGILAHRPLQRRLQLLHGWMHDDHIQRVGHHARATGVLELPVRSGIVFVHFSGKLGSGLEIYRYTVPV